MNRANLIILLICVVGAALGARTRGSRIVGGTPTVVSQYPYMSNMQYHWQQSWWFHWCGGSLITSLTILSAAHCYYEDPNYMWRVRLGTTWASSGGSLHEVARFILHEDYDYEQTINDVAIVVLATPAVLGGDIAVARIAGPNFHLPEHSLVTAIGWGALASNGAYPEQLQHVDILIVNHQICTTRYAQLKVELEALGYFWPYYVDEGMVCAGILDVGGRDACQGDSGGPLAYDGDILYGITSWGYGCAHPTYPGVNARVSYYSDWIVGHGSV